MANAAKSINKDLHGYWRFIENISWCKMTEIVRSINSEKILGGKVVMFGNVKSELINVTPA